MVTTKSLNEDKADLAVVHQDCMNKAQTYELDVSSRGEELQALAKSKKLLVEAVSGTRFAQADSFIELMSSSKGDKFLHMLKTLASDYSSKSLSQLASRVESAIRISSSSGEDPFVKIKEMANDMIAKLENEQA